MKQMTRQYSRMAATISKDVDTLVRQFGVPTDLDAAHRLAAQVAPVIRDHRNDTYRAEAELIRDEFPLLDLAELAPYPDRATEKLVRHSAGLTPRPVLTELEYYDESTQRMARDRVAPWVYPGEEQILKTMSNRLGAGAARHTRSASRDLVTDTAVKNRVGWARQLDGAEYCAFCAMLVSRGAVYSKQSVKFRTHDNCNCTATLITDSAYQWEGKAEAESLYRLWKQSAGLAGFREKLAEEWNV